MGDYVHLGWTEYRLHKEHYHEIKNRDVIMLQLVQKTETKSDSD